MELGGLTPPTRSTRPCRPGGSDKADEIYQLIPDFGGFLVKANSEGQPGPRGLRPQPRRRAPTCWPTRWRRHGGMRDVARLRVRPRSAGRPRQAGLPEFTPLDGKFRANVLLQVKNGRSTSSHASPSARCSAPCRRRP